MQCINRGVEIAMFLLQLGELGDEFAVVVIIIHVCFFELDRADAIAGGSCELSSSYAPLASCVQCKDEAMKQNLFVRQIPCNSLTGRTRRRHALRERGRRMYFSIHWRLVAGGRISLEFDRQAH